MADPYTGFHLLRLESEQYTKYFVDLRDYNQMEDVTTFQSFGKIERFSLSDNKKMLAIYSNTEQGDLIVLMSDLSQELNR